MNGLTNFADSANEFEECRLGQQNGKLFTQYLKTKNSNIPSSINYNGCNFSIDYNKWPFHRFGSHRKDFQIPVYRKASI